MITATTLVLTPRTRASGAMSDCGPSTAAGDSVAVALDVHPRTATTIAALTIAFRAVFVIAFPSSSHLEAENAGQNQKGPKTGVECAHP
jgi:hypothetical protein